MSLIGIPLNFFNNNITIQSEDQTADSVGDFTSEWSDFISNAPAAIQPVRVTENKMMRGGKEYVIDKKAYMPTDLGHAPLPGHRLVDNDTGEVYDIIGVQRHVAARAGLGLGHHFKLFLQIPRGEHG